MKQLDFSKIKRLVKIDGGFKEWEFIVSSERKHVSFKFWISVKIAGITVIKYESDEVVLIDRKDSKSDTACGYIIEKNDMV